MGIHTVWHSNDNGSAVHNLTAAGAGVKDQLELQMFRIPLSASWTCKHLGIAACLTPEGRLRQSSMQEMLCIPCVPQLELHAPVFAA